MSRITDLPLGFQIQLTSDFGISLSFWFSRCVNFLITLTRYLKRKLKWFSFNTHTHTHTHTYIYIYIYIYIYFSYTLVWKIILYPTLERKQNMGSLPHCLPTTVSQKNVTNFLLPRFLPKVKLTCGSHLNIQCHKFFPSIELSPGNAHRYKHTHISIYRVRKKNRE